MADTKQAIGIILRRNDFREYDSRILVYTLEHGLLDLVVRGTKRKKSKMVGHIEPLNLTNLMIAPGKNYDYAASVVATHTWPEVRKNYEANVVSQKAAKFLARVIKPGICDRELLKQLADLMYYMPRSENNIIDFWQAVFVLKALAHLGYRPNLNKCVQCQNNDFKTANFDLQNFELYCPKCKTPYHNLTVSREFIKLLQIVLQQDYKYIANISYKSSLNQEISFFCEKYQQWIE